jgi:hypothetical protein
MVSYRVTSVFTCKLFHLQAHDILFNYPVHIVANNSYDTNCSFYYAIFAHDQTNVFWHLKVQAEASTPSVVHIMMLSKIMCSYVICLYEYLMHS